MYSLPGPKRSVYLITLITACDACDGPSAVSIEKFGSQHELEKWACCKPPELPFEKWADTIGTTIVTGFRKSEFVDATKKHLIGIKSDDYVEKDGDVLDVLSAEIILEEMYDDSNFDPILANQLTPPAPQVNVQRNAAQVAPFDGGGV